MSVDEIGEGWPESKLIVYNQPIIVADFGSYEIGKSLSYYLLINDQHRRFETTATLSKYFPDITVDDF